MISLIVTDIDGCLLASASTRFNLEMFARLQEWNRASRSEPGAAPPITICTGRPTTFSEAIARAMDTHLPLICESGGVLFDHASLRMRFHPLYENGGREKVDRLREAVEQRFLNGDRPIILEPGKITETTLIPQPPLTVDDIWDEAIEFAADFGSDFQVTRTRRVLNFSHKIMNKGAGVTWLAEALGMPLAQIAGFGDTMPDVAFLEAVGFAGCPANADDGVKAVSDFIAPSGYDRGFMEFLDEVERLNELANKSASQASK